MLKAKHNCWTCKERKVGCDRTLPECTNCKRSKRNCQGYGIKLAWPDKHDGRRKQKKYQAMPEGSAKNYVMSEGQFTFLNMTTGDLEGVRINIQEMVRRQIAEFEGLYPRIAPRMSSMFIEEKDGLFLSYYDAVVARMITTIDDNTNGFRLSLIPMALRSTDASCQSLLHATLALSSFHLGRQEEALKHKVKAIKSLSESFQDAASLDDRETDGVRKLSQFAACMMLCVYSVFDASDTTWHLHLQGANTIRDGLSLKEKKLSCFTFMQPWFDYHDTFSGYSHPAQLPSSEQHCVPNIVLPESTPATQKIIGLLGCSTELLRLISCINQLRTLKTSPHWNTARAGPGSLEISLLIRSRLLVLKQEIHLQIGETTGTIDHARITLTAELYRIATILYLYQVAPPSVVPENAIQSLVRDGFIVLEHMEVCTSPWPLFILACNVTDDGDRIKILEILEIGARKRRVGNYQIIKGLIKAVWKQQDLAADDKEKRVIDWRDLIEPGTSMPSFI